MLEWLLTQIAKLFSGRRSDPLDTYDRLTGRMESLLNEARQEVADCHRDKFAVERKLLEAEARLARLESTDE